MEEHFTSQYKPEKTQEYWIAQAWYEVYRRGLEAHKNEASLNSYVQALRNFCDHYLEPYIQEKLEPLFLNIENLKSDNKTKNPLSSFGHHFNERLEIAKEIAREIKKALYESGLMLEEAGKAQEVEVVLLKSQVKNMEKELSQLPGVLIVDDNQLSES
jgi:hypothetical protein